MGELILRVLDWSEIWALLIPVAVLLFNRKRPASLKPVIIYIWLALLLNIIIDGIMWLNFRYPDMNLTNNPVYNIHSVVRLTCFSIFFVKQPQAYFTVAKKALMVVALIFLLVNFIFFENFFNYDSLSGNLLAAEAYLLLIYCMLYYLSELREDRFLFSGSPDFWVATGLCIYVVTNFFVFLFYLPMLDVNPQISVNMWNVHNIVFIIFCIFITKAFYGPFRNKYPV